MAQWYYKSVPFQVHVNLVAGIGQVRHFGQHTVKLRHSLVTVEDEGLRHAAEVNPEDRFALVFGNLLRRLFVLDGVWQATIVALDGGWYQHFDFLRFDPTGEFYLHRVMQDDLSEKVNPGIAMDVILMICRVAEVLAVGVSMARNLGWDPNGTVGFAFQWTGLNGRELSSWVNPFRWGARWALGRAAQPRNHSWKCHSRYLILR